KDQATRRHNRTAQRKRAEARRRTRHLADRHGPLHLSGIGINRIERSPRRWAAGRTAGTAQEAARHSVRGSGLFREFPIAIQAATSGFTLVVVISARDEPHLRCEIVDRYDQQVVSGIKRSSAP